MDKTGVALLSVASNTVLTVSKVLIGLVSGSVSIISEGIHSGIDLIASVIALIAVRESGKPADNRHAYGHGKIENVSGTIEAALIFVAALWIIFEAVRKLTDGVELADYSLGLFVMGISAISNTIVSTLLMRVAKRTDSVALEADALHLRTDVYTSAGVFIGLILMKITGWAILDPLVALAVAILIIKAAYDLTKESFMPLVDASLPLVEQETISSIINRHSSQFVEFHELRTRKAGAERHIDLHLVVPKYASVVEVHELCDQIEREVSQELRGTSVLIHAEPCAKLEETCPLCEEPENLCDYREGKKTCRGIVKEQESP
ncbi:MAG: cation diffusion facilitator family transporter [Desulfitobacteriaceae bacterium]